MAEPSDSIRDEILQETVRLDRKPRMKSWDFDLERAADVAFRVELREGDPIDTQVWTGFDNELVQRATVFPGLALFEKVATGDTLSVVVRIEAGKHALVVLSGPDDAPEHDGFSLVHVVVHKSEPQ